MIRHFFLLLHPCCCRLPTPTTLVSKGIPIFPHMVHQPASPSIWSAVQSLQRGLSTNPGVIMCYICGCSGRDDVSCVRECYKADIVVMNSDRLSLAHLLLYERFRSCNTFAVHRYNSQSRRKTLTVSCRHCIYLNRFESFNVLE